MQTLGVVGRTNHNYAYVTFVGQGHMSKFKVTGGKSSFYPLKVQMNLGKPVPASWHKSKPELQIVDK